MCSERTAGRQRPLPLRDAKSVHRCSQRAPCLVAVKFPVRFFFFCFRCSTLILTKMGVRKLYLAQAVDFLTTYLNAVVVHLKKGQVDFFLASFWVGQFN